MYDICPRFELIRKVQLAGAGGGGSLLLIPNLFTSV